LFELFFALKKAKKASGESATASEARTSRTRPNKLQNASFDKCNQKPIFAL